MGRLWWRERWSVLGCRRGWLRLAGLAAFAIVGYFVLYAWLRATGEIRIQGWERRDGTFSYDIALRAESDALLFFSGFVSPDDGPILPVYRLGEWSWAMRMMWPAARLEVALDRRGWLPSDCIPKGKYYDRELFRRGIQMSKTENSKR